MFLSPPASPEQQRCLGELFLVDGGDRLIGRFVFLVTGVKFLPLCLLSIELALCFHKRLSAASARLAAPPVVFRRRLRERGKVWLEQLVALATLCATAADWNRNWPIHVSLQAGSGPCLVLTDYLISIQTARVSAPLLRSLEKRPRPASF